MAGPSTAVEWIGAVIGGIIVLVLLLWFLSWLFDRAGIRDARAPFPEVQTSPRQGGFERAPRVEAPSGWEATRTYGLSGERARECRGRIVVDINSPQCITIAPRVRGGPYGRRCPNRCVQ